MALRLGRNLCHQMMQILSTAGGKLMEKPAIDDDTSHSSSLNQFYLMLVAKGIL